jgi:arylsulfatase A-like enzyme
LSTGGKRAIIKGKWKLIFYKTNSELNPRVELFDLSQDVSEKRNVADQYPKVVSELSSLMNSAHTPAKCKRFKLAAEISDQ